MTTTELSLSDILDRFDTTRTWWVTTSGEDGPHAAPTWGVAHEDSLWFFGPPSAVRTRNLVVDDRVVVHTEDGDSPLIVHGRAIEVGGVHEHPRVNARYRAKYNRDIDLDFLPDVPEAAENNFFSVVPTRAIGWVIASKQAWAVQRWRAQC